MLLSLSPNFCMMQRQCSDIKFSYFIFLQPKVSDSKIREEDASPSTFLPGRGGALMLSSSSFCMAQSQSSVIKISSFIFLPPEVRDNKAQTWDG